jgi:hypothetical protein
MDGGDHLRALADRGGDALRRARAHVADREDPVAARLQRRPTVAEVGADEALRVAFDVRLVQPGGVRLGADQEEQMPDLAPRLLGRRQRAPAHRLEDPVCAFELGDFGDTSTLRRPSMRSTR